MSQTIRPAEPKAELKAPKVEVKLVSKPEVKDFNKELDKRIAESKDKYAREHNRAVLECLKLQLEVKNLLGGK